MKTVPTSDYAVVRDTERDMIVSAGNYGAMVEEARTFNQIYQSTAYRAERWEQR